MNLTISILAVWTLFLAIVACGPAGVGAKTASRVEVGFKNVSSPVEAVVLRVIDGDTLEVEFDSGIKDRVRLLAVDTPETRQTNKAGEYGSIRDIDCLKEWGTRATGFAKETLEGQRVQLISESSQGRDIYDRLLAYVHLEGGDDFNRQLVEKGSARVYEEGESQREPEYLLLQENAVQNRAGLWDCQRN